MTSMITGYWITQVIHAAAVYSFADHLGEGRLTAAELASREGLDPLATRRLLKACVALDLAVDNADNTFSPTPLLGTLSKEAAGSLRGLALALPAHHIWATWGRLAQSIKSGRPQAEAALGMPIWDYLASQPEDEKQFVGAMVSAAAAPSIEVARIIAPREGDVIADIGGASGTLLHAILNVHPAARGIVFDRPNIAPHAIDAARQAGLENRIDVTGGDFLVSVPEADILLLRYILHDWDDDTSIRILRSCRRALRPGGRVAIVERLYDGISAELALMDLNMLVSLGGRERNLGEFDALLTIANLRRTKVTQTGAGE